MKVLLTGPARADLAEIGGYIAADSPLAAKRLIGQLRLSCSDLGQFPQKFTVVGILGDMSVRRRPHGSYAIYYVIIDDHVEVLRILHSARDADRLLFPEG